MTVFKALRVVGGLGMAGGVVVSAARIVMLFQAQAFDQVAGAGLIGLTGLAAGGFLLWLGFALEPTRGAVAPAAPSLFRSRRSSPQAAGAVPGCVGVLGWLAVLGGGGWAAVTVMVMGLGAPESTLTLLLAAPGALVALVGLGMVLFGSVTRRQH
ncbi:MAG: hypothetical protein HQL40_03620 [Alphaproteobacteria bacterium]|nr:hypothetical protein [Alphaproteobacteria bacterium]